MSSRFVKLSCAAALALPLAAVAMPAAHATNYAPENDCNRHFSGAVTGTPHQGDGCYGIDQRSERSDPSGHNYVVQAVATSSGFVAYCDGGNVMDKSSLDTAIEATNAATSTIEAPNQADGSRPVGHFVPTADGAFSLLCLDDHSRAR
jgi:hypothetical protein